jgi:hypothetical protein
MKYNQIRSNKSSIIIKINRDGRHVVNFLYAYRELNIYVSQMQHCA